MTSLPIRNKKLLAVAGAIVAVGFSVNAFARPAASVPAPSGYPEKPVTIVAPFALGGNADTAARILAEHAPSVLGVPVAVVNRTGKDGAAGSLYVKNAAPGGYTLLMGGSPSSAALPAVRPETPYRPDDFTPLGLVELNPIGCAVSARETALSDAASLIKAFKDSPDKVSYAWSGEVAGQFGKAFIRLAGGDLQKVKAEGYPGANDSVAAVVNGHNTFVCASLQSLRGLVRLGTLKLILVNEKTRNKNFPRVPTTAEFNLQQLEKITAWSALLGPANLPRPVVDKWRAVLAKLAADEGWRKRLEDAGSTSYILSPEESARFISEQYEVYKQFAHSSAESSK